MNEQEPNVIRFFTQCPNIILYGLPDIAIQDKWALLALVGRCWDRSRGNNTLKYLEGPYKLSLREIEGLTGIKHNALCKTTGKNPREGVLDRLQSLGYVTVFKGKPINEITGKKERSQTYLYIHLEKLWHDNLAFSERWRMPANRLVDIDTFTTTEESTVHHVTHTVPHMNSDCHYVNKSGHVVNHTVRDGSTKLAVIQRNTDNTFKDESNTDRDNKEEQTQQRRSPQASTTRDIVLTPQGEHILNLYNEFKGRKAIRNAATLLAANKLGEVVGSDEDFLDVLKAIANDPFLKQKQVRTDLDFVYRKYDGFLDIVEHARGKQSPGASNTQTDYNEVAGMTDEQRAAYKQQQQEKMQQAQPPGVDRATLMKLKPEERIAVLKKMRACRT